MNLLLPAQRTIPGILQVNAAAELWPIFTEEGVNARKLESQYHRIPTQGVHDHASLWQGQQLLLRLGLIVERDGSLYSHPDLRAFQDMAHQMRVEVLTERALLTWATLWLPTFADADEVHWERVPAEAHNLLASVFEDTGRREAFILASARKVDAALLAEIGSDGEVAVVARCREHLSGKNRGDLAAMVTRVSLTDDTAGFDVYALDCAGSRHHMEVKTTRSITERIGFYLSRNEAIVGQRDECWAIVVARQVVVSGDGQAETEVVGWLKYTDIHDLLPSDTITDTDSFARWASTKIVVPQWRLRPGLPLD
ncbi:protein NO VEIN domain-containing protein [Catellatospora vulcania]|uniref:protein NO VEIN domain-containing protein n=1 Tax=Catellatospora vulcania TaxID=1460450 RepID=UPI0012D40173|nr:DUF3883 domain-containing protein [Catellatospora vulcania]